MGHTLDNCININYLKSPEKIIFCEVLLSLKYFVYIKCYNWKVFDEVH